MRIQAAPDCSSVILIWFLLGERDWSWNPQEKKNVALGYKAAVTKKAHKFVTHGNLHGVLPPPEGVWLSTERVTSFAHDIAPWLLMLLMQLAPATDQPFCVSVVRKPMSEIPQGSEGQGAVCVGNLSTLQDLFGIHIHLQECIPSILYCC